MAAQAFEGWSQHLTRNRGRSGSLHERAPSWLLALAMCGTGCLSHRAAQPNLLLVTVDTLRADHCSAYGYPLPTTPHLERLARQGVLLETAYAPMPLTGPSHASLMTGLYPGAHGVVRNAHVLAVAHPTLAERLQAQGYVTGAVVSAFPLDRRFGLARGFQHYDDQFAPGEASVQETRWEGQPFLQAYDRRAPATTERALAWLRARPPGQPFFLWVHYFDPHTPYDAPAAYRVFAAASGSSGTGDPIAAYDSEIRFADSQVGRLLDGLDAQAKPSDTLVVITGDHGEGLGQHGVQEHGAVVYEEAVRVPLVFRFTNRLAAGQRRSAPVELIDVFPTVVELLGAGPPPAGHGQSLVPILSGRSPTPPDRRAVILQQEFLAPGTDIFAVRHGAHKYIESRERGRIIRQELYDLSADPAELHDLASERAEPTGRLARLLEAARARGGQGPRQEIAPEHREGLRALGYVE